MLSRGAQEAYENGDLGHVVYADDTLLLSVSAKHLQEYLTSIATAGERYGMELHWGKFQLLPVQCSPTILARDGQRIMPR